MISLIGAVFLASLLGSMHCAGMCGGFLAFAVAAPDGSSPSRAALQAGYNIGRLVTYVILGIIAGSIGAAVDLGGSLVGVQRTAAVLAGAMMIGFGLVTVLRITGVHVPRLPLPVALRKTVIRGHRVASQWPPMGRAVTVGLLTTLLPCGWLYAFVITAAGTASPLFGGVTMASFWLGTLPVMIGLGTGLQALAGPFRRRLPLVTALVLVGVGLFTVVGRVNAPAMASTMSTPMNAADNVQRVETLNSEEMPCCHGH
jgi:uncharacterized protein